MIDPDGMRMMQLYVDGSWKWVEIPESDLETIYEAPDNSGSNDDQDEAQVMPPPTMLQGLLRFITLLFHGTGPNSEFCLTT